MANDPTVVFTPSGLKGTVAAGTTILDAARQLGADLDSVCSGRGICGRCQVTPTFGQFPKWNITAESDHLSDWSTLEEHYEGRRPIEPGNRLGCGAEILDDLVIDIPASSQMHRQVVRKDVAIDETLVLDPAMTLHYVELEEVGEFDAESIETRVRGALAAAWNIDALEIPAERLRRLQDAAADGKLTLALERPRRPERPLPRLAQAWPGYVDRIVGAAIDVGSTTIAGHLCDLRSGEVLASAGQMNPQIRFGEDLMSRVSYAMMNPNGDAELTAAVRSALGELVTNLLADADIAADQLLDVVIVGNPIMHHLVLGLDPIPLGQAPFPLATDAAVITTAARIGIDGPAATYVLPCIAGHVGADTAAVILAEKPYEHDRVQLLVDVGTNAEIVLGSADQLYAASSPTGPAFEGAQISAGQRATAGAIERVRIDRDTLEARVRVIGSDLWSDEPGFTDAVAKTGVTGICGSGIIEVIAEMYLAGICDHNGVIQGGLAERSDRIVEDERTFSYVMYRHADGTELRVTQSDVRAIQLAKAALRAGIDLLMEHAGIDAVADIRLAGAFGAHIDPLYALVLGLVPDAPVDAVRSVGNAAGSGAVRALLSLQQRREIESVISEVTKIETALEPRFQELFVAAMGFPHTTAPADHLSQVVDLPPRTETSNEPRRRRRRAGKDT